MQLRIRTGINPIAVGSNPGRKRRENAAPDGAQNVRGCVGYKDAAPTALLLPEMSLRALVNNIGNGIRRARFFTPFVRDTGRS